MEKIIIYTLSDPRNKEIRYLGKTTDKSFRKRFISHMFEGRNLQYTSHKSRWIRGIILRGDDILMEILDEIPYTDNWEWLESYWISQLKSWGFNLLNMTDSGDGNKNQEFSRESVLRRNAKLKGKVRTLEQRQRYSDCRMGIPLTEAHRINTRNGIIALQGKPVIQYDINGCFIAEFKCVIDAALSLGRIHLHSAIHRCCQHKPGYFTSGGYKWEYKKF
jgi:hypothetical protein